MAAALITAGCGGSNSSDNASGNTSSSQPSTVGPSDMPNEQAPPTRLLVDVTIKGGKVTPTNEQLKAGVKRADRHPGQQRRRRRAARALDAGAQLQRRGQAGAVLPVHRRRARQGRRRAAQAEPDHRHHSGAVIADRSTAVLAHGLGGSTDLPIPLHLCAHRRGVGVDVHVRRRGARLAAAAVRSRQTGPSAAAVGDDTGRRPGDALGRRDRGAAVRGLGGDRRVVRPAGRRQPAARRVLRVAVGRAGGAVACRRAGVARDLPGAHGAPAAWRPIARPALSGAGGLLARRGRPVRFRLAGARQPRPGIPWRDQDLAAASTSP